MLNGRNLAVSSAVWALLAAAAAAAVFSPHDGMPPVDDLQSLSALVLQPVNPPVPRLPIGRGVDAFRTRAAASAWRSVPNRNANPLNIKLGAGSREYVRRGHATISDIPPLDGGRFLRFQSPATGFRAALDLLTSRPYRDLAVDAALRRWSNDGYGAEILGGTRLDGRARVRHLTRSDFKALLGAMAAAEGYRSTTVDNEIATALDR